MDVRVDCETSGPSVARRERIGLLALSHDANGPLSRDANHLNSTLAELRTIVLAGRAEHAHLAERGKRIGLERLKLVTPLSFEAAGQPPLPDWVRCGAERLLARRKLSTWASFQRMLLAAAERDEPTMLAEADLDLTEHLATGLRRVLLHLGTRQTRYDVVYLGHCGTENWQRDRVRVKPCFQLSGAPPLFMQAARGPRCKHALLVSGRRAARRLHEAHEAFNASFWRRIDGINRRHAHDACPAWDAAHRSNGSTSKAEAVHWSPLLWGGDNVIAQALEDGALSGFEVWPPIAEQKVIREPHADRPWEDSKEQAMWRGSQAWRKLPAPCRALRNPQPQ